MFSHDSGRRLPSLKLLLGFEAAARHGNFSRAADELHLSQSAISHQVLLLEAQVGQPLFRRLGRGVELTLAGELLQRSVQRSVATLRSGLGRIATYLDPGLVTVVAPAPLLQGWLLPQLGALQAAVPGLCPVLSCDETARFVDEIDVDLVITDRPVQQAGLQQAVLCEERWITVAAPAVAARLQGLPLDQHRSQAPLVCLEAAILRDDVAAIFAQHLAGLRIGLVLDDPRLVLQAAIQGQGVACMGQLLAAAALQAGHLVRLPAYADAPGSTWWLARVAGPARSAQVEQCHAALIALAQASGPAPAPASAAA